MPLTVAFAGVQHLVVVVGVTRVALQLAQVRRRHQPFAVEAAQLRAGLQRAVWTHAPWLVADHSAE